MINNKMNATRFTFNDKCIFSFITINTARSHYLGRRTLNRPRKSKSHHRSIPTTEYFWATTLSEHGKLGWKKSRVKLKRKHEKFADFLVEWPRFSVETDRIALFALLRSKWLDWQQESNISTWDWWNSLTTSHTLQKKKSLHQTICSMHQRVDQLNKICSRRRRDMCLFAQALEIFQWVINTSRKSDSGKIIYINYYNIDHWPKTSRWDPQIKQYWCSVNFIYIHKHRTHIFKPINKH